MSTVKDELKFAVIKVDRAQSALEKYCRSDGICEDDVLAIYKEGSRKILSKRTMAKCKAYIDARKEYRRLRDLLYPEL